jgi:hypothetical protein
MNTRNHFNTGLTSVVLATMCVSQKKHNSKVVGCNSKYAKKESDPTGGESEKTAL